MTESKETTEDDELDVSWYPNSIDECHELLTFYREQMMIFQNERSKYEAVLNSLAMTNEEKHKLEWNLHNKTQQNEKLKKQLSDTHILLYNEKNSNIAFESEIKSLSAQIKELTQNKSHLLELLESANDNISDMSDNNKRHKWCKACNHKHHKKYIQTQPIPQKLTTIYLPNDNADTMQSKLDAKEDELMKLKQQSLKINEYLITDRNKAHRSLEILRNEYNAKFESLQSKMTDLSKQHLFNLKEYLNYRRNAKQEIHDLQSSLLHIKQENDQMKNKYDNKVDHMVSNTNKIEKELKKKSNKLIHGFRVETMQKHEELNNVKDELMTLTKSYQFDMKNLKSKLNATKKKNKKLNQINKCQKIGIQTDVGNLKKRLNKLQKAINNLSVQNVNDAHHMALQKEIDKVKKTLMEIAKITRSKVMG
eukprot:635401_1